MRPPFETFKQATCKGSILLGSACGYCERCQWERSQMQNPTRAEALADLDKTIDELIDAEDELRAVAERPKVEWKLNPDEQAWWWHWNGEDYAVPHVYAVLVSNTGGPRYFVSFPDCRWCDEMGGFWLKVQYPNVPSREDQAELKARLQK